MVREIRIYVEGGGDGKDTKALLRQGMSQFLSELRDLAKNRRIRWSIVACGSRNDALDDFRSALRSHPNAFNLLLVDAEAISSFAARDDQNYPAPKGLEGFTGNLSLGSFLTVVQIIATADCAKKFGYFGSDLGII